MTPDLPTNPLRDEHLSVSAGLRRLADGLMLDIQRDRGRRREMIDQMRTLSGETHKYYERAQRSYDQAAFGATHPPVPPA